MSSSCPPVLLLTFRRLDSLKRIFEVLGEVQPKNLWIAQDGPRSEIAQEVTDCRAVRQYLDEAVTWPCTVRTLYREQNRGPKYGLAEAITWFLDEAEEGLILEDDCLPSPQFFPFCAELLDRYRDDSRVFHISGTSFRTSPAPEGADYYFSRYNHGWGWATWKRAWKHQDLEMNGLDTFLAAADQSDFWDSAKERLYWTKMFRWVRDRQLAAWDYQWKWALWRQGALALVPRENLISNLGFGEGATNTTAQDSKGNRPWGRLNGPLKHPQFFLRDRAEDRKNFQAQYWGRWSSRFKSRLKKLLSLIGGGP